MLYDFHRDIYHCNISFTQEYPHKHSIELSSDRLFGSFVRSEQEIQIKEIIRQNMDHINPLRRLRQKICQKKKLVNL